MCKEVSSRIMWVKMKFGGEMWVFICAYAPVNGAREEERERFWSELNECWESFGINDKICLLGDLNAGVGREEMGRIIGPFGVGERNDNGESLLAVSYTHLRAHETPEQLVCRLLLEKKKK